MSTPAAGAAAHSTVVDLDDIELALVNGGPPLAVITALTALRRAEAVQVGELHGTRDAFVATGQLPDAASELERELLELGRQTPPVPACDVLRRATDSPSLARTVPRLVAAGLLRDEDDARRLRGLVAASVLAALMALVLLALLLRNASAFVLLGAGVVGAAAAVWWLHVCGRRATSKGRAAIKRARSDRAGELRGTPPLNLALAVALFGASALWAADPLLAVALGVTHDEELAVGGHVDAFLAGFDSGCGGCGCGGCG